MRLRAAMFVAAPAQMLGCLRAQPFVTVELSKLFQNECLATMGLLRLLREPATTTSTTQKFAKLPCGSELYSLHAIDATTSPPEHTLLDFNGKQLKCTRNGRGTRARLQFSRSPRSSGPRRRAPRRARRRPCRPCRACRRACVHRKVRSSVTRRFRTPRRYMPPGIPPPAPPPSAARIGFTTASNSFCFASYSSFSAI